MSHDNQEQNSVKTLIFNCTSAKVSGVLELILPILYPTGVTSAINKVIYQKMINRKVLIWLRASQVRKAQFVCFCYWSMFLTFKCKPQIWFRKTTLNLHIETLFKPFISCRFQVYENIKQIERFYISLRILHEWPS